MPTDYENLYQEQRHVLGKPTQIFVDFFDAYDNSNADVLDVGCGQGRDALFIARKGHHVVGVDLSTTGIAQLLEDATRENLNIEGIVADLEDYVPEGDFDVIVVDRTLHMLDADVRLTVLERLAPVTKAAGFILIADEPSNMAAFKTFFKQDSRIWRTHQATKNFLCVQKIDAA